MKLFYALLRPLSAFEVEFPPEDLIQIETSLDCLGLPCVCAHQDQGTSWSASIQNRRDMNPWWLQVPILGGHFPSWAARQSSRTRAGLSSRASPKTYERVHARCAEPNELSGRNYGVCALLLQQVALYFHIFFLFEQFGRPNQKKWWNRKFSSGSFQHF